MTSVSDTQFTLNLRAPTYPSLPLTAISDPSLPSGYALIFDPAIEHGTPAILNNTYVEFTIDDAPYSMSYGDPGQVRGLALLVTAAEGHDGRPGMRVGEGDLGPPMTSASQSFFVCNREIAGEQRLALHFGVFNLDGTSPYDCVVAQLEQNFNVGE